MSKLYLEFGQKKIVGDVIKFKMVFLVPQNAAYSIYVYREPDCFELYRLFWKGHFPGS